MTDAQEKWIKYEPVEIPKSDERYIVENYYFTYDGKDKIILGNGEYQAEILFNGYTVATRISFDGNRIGVGTDHPLYIGDNDFIFKTKNSEFIQWHIKESADIYKIEDFVHFCIMDTFLVLDVLVLSKGEEPTITVTKIGSKSASVGEEIVQISKSELKELRALKAEVDEKERQKRLEEENDPFAAVRDWEGWD